MKKHPLPSFLDVLGAVLLVLPFLSLAAIGLSYHNPALDALIAEPEEIKLVEEVHRQRRYANLSVRELRELSFVGDCDATFELARRTENGIGVERDFPRAAELYVIAEEQGRELPPDVEDRIFP